MMWLHGRHTSFALRESVHDEVNDAEQDKVFAAIPSDISSHTADSIWVQIL